jgi:6-phosphogluconolactonase
MDKDKQGVWVASTWVEKFDSWRITFTPQLINMARAVIFLVSGKDKAHALQAVLEGDYLPEQHPSQLISPLSNDLLWLVDKASAAGLKNL